jgi:hypothetical protein
MSTAVVDKPDELKIPEDILAPLKQAWRQYKQASGAVRTCLIDDERAGHSGSVINELGETVDAFGETARLYSDFEREEGDDAKRSNIAFGVVVVSHKTECAIHLLNEAKAAVIAAIDDAKKQTVFSIEAIKSAAGFPRLHYYKVLRPAKGFTGRMTESVRLSVEQKIDIERRTVEACREQLQEFGDHQPHIQIQLDLLNRLPPDEMLAYVFETQNLRVVANASFPKDPNTGIREHRKLRSVMPFYVVSNDPRAVPDIRLPTYVRLEDRLERKERSDRKIDPEPFLPSIHVHRYTGNV